MRQGKAKYVFPGSNTPSGFVSFYREGLKGTERVFILKGGPGTGKSTLMRKIGLAMLERGYDVEFWQCSSDNDSLDGVLIPAISAAVIDGTAPHVMDPAYPGAVDEIVNLGQYWNDAYLREHKREIIDITQDISVCFEQCYAKLAEAGSAQRQLAAMNRARRQEPKLTETGKSLMEKIFRRERPPVRHLFASSVTPRGLISFTEAISRQYAKRYLLTGPPGCGKEKLLEEVAAYAEEQGLSMEVYHNTFLPQQIELLVLPEAGIALADAGETPRETLPEDTLIDCGEFLEQAHDAQAEEGMRERFAKLGEEAAAHIADAKAKHDMLESYYSKAMDFEAVDDIGNDLFNKILALAAGAALQPR